MSKKFKQTTIGILTVPLSKSKKKKADVVSSYIPDSYVKWIESSGARVVPIPFNWTEKKIRNALDQVNGVLFPGGDVDRTKNDDFKEYIDTFKYIFNYLRVTAMVHLLTLSEDGTKPFHWNSPIRTSHFWHLGSSLTGSHLPTVNGSRTTPSI